MSKRRQHGTGSVHRRSSDGRWIGSLDVGWTKDGKRKRITVSADNEALCKKRLRDKAVEIQRDGVPVASPRTSIKSWAETWLERTQHKVRPKTWIANRSAVTQWIVPSMGHVRVSSITAADVEAFKDSMRGNLAPSSMSRTHNVLNKMLKDAMIEGYRINAGVILVEKSAPGESTQEAIPFKQALLMLAQIELEPDPSRWVAIVLNGMRQGERLGLTWDCIDFEKKTIDISWQLQELHYNDNQNKHLGFRLPDGFACRQLTGRWHLTRPKTKAGRRIIPMTAWMETALRSWQAIAPESPYDLVWCSDSGMPIDPKDDRLDWKRLQDQAGVLHRTGRYFNVHEGRHTTITLLKELGVPDDVIEQIVGHSKLVQSYVHVDLQPKVREALDRLSQRLALTV